MKAFSSTSDVGMDVCCHIPGMSMNLRSTIFAPDFLMKAKAAFSLERCKELEKTLNHDVIAFTTNVAESIGAPANRWLHFGLTSSDVILGVRGPRHPMRHYLRAGVPVVINARIDAIIRSPGRDPVAAKSETINRA